MPYTRPHFEIACAAMISPSGPRAAGRFGVSLLSLGGVVVDPTILDSPAKLSNAWSIVEERAQEFAQPTDRRRWRVVSPVHIADTAEQARADVRYGLPAFADYFGGGGGFVQSAAASTPEELIDFYANSGNAVIGTPDDLIAKIEKLQLESGGFGTFLALGHDWANREATLHSYELMARYVIPHFNGRLAAPYAAHEWGKAMRDQIFTESFAAIGAEIVSHQQTPAS